MLARARWGLLVETSVGIKATMALSGAVMSAWVCLHMAGNLLVFAGPELIDGYGAALQGSPLVWGMRAGLLASVVAHVIGAFVLARRAHEARPIRYARGLRARTSTLSSRSMRWGGLAVGLFLAYHVAHIYGPLHASYVPGAVHHNLVTGLADPLVGGLYALAAVVFGLHLHHGTWSLFRSLGLEAHDATLRCATAALAATVTLGFLAPCVAALAGWI